LHARFDDLGGHFDSASYDHEVNAATADDAELLRRARGGDLDAFADLVRMHEQRLRLVVARLLDDPRDVEEAVQDAFVQAWRHVERFRGDAAVFTWLYRIGVNEALARRRRKSLPTTELDSPAAAALAESRREVQPEASAEASDLRARLIECLGELPFEHREAVVLRDIAGLTNEEVAEALGVTVSAAKSRIHRGRMQLRERVEPAAGPDP
jgi:RNA polymerase sigma-70 factor (ECF subfamily)